MGSEESGNEKPIHEVGLNTFYMGQYPVTQNVWETMMGENPSYFRGNYLPVEQVSWEDVQLFLEKLNVLLNLERDKRYRLPTEAEWEYAARGGPFFQGLIYAGGERFDEVAWYDENSQNQTHEVGSKAPNELGIYDMSGNIWEWCQDWYGRDYYEECYNHGIVTNSKGTETGEYRVFRGGSWRSNPIRCRVAVRGYVAPSRRYRNLGFRLSRTTL